jgi:hypothetical protein
LGDNFLVIHTCHNLLAVAECQSSPFRKGFASRSCYLFLLFVISLILSTSLSALAEETPLINFTEEEQAWLAGHPEIVLGASTDYPPMVIKRADGTHDGVLVGIFEQVSQYFNFMIFLHIEDS